MHYFYTAKERLLMIGVIDIGKTTEMIYLVQPITTIPLNHVIQCDIYPFLEVTSIQ